MARIVTVLWRSGHRGQSASTAFVSLAFLAASPIFGALLWLSHTINPGRCLLPAERKILSSGVWAALSEAAHAQAATELAENGTEATELTEGRKRSKKSKSGGALRVRDFDPQVVVGIRREAWIPCVVHELDDVVCDEEAFVRLLNRMRIHQGHSPLSWMMCVWDASTYGFSLAHHIHTSYRRPGTTTAASSASRSVRLTAETLRHEFVHSLQSLATSRGELEPFLAAYVGEILFLAATACLFGSAVDLYHGLSFEIQAYALEDLP
ncbi:uncharacterized protein AMSG_08878 [Thecamonas trahens ATCC 50062]|uniref:Uncharacterized protein n=1 Tax=Thecamonas trahens ATCC 50062 TaxID=461836 RepID=A0A0L0DPL8_THETB|nr:hypothetical protein AMSG_08878 [Thecamonas trahens ATCC 50062]KNC53373.1 hypothetical protein AMSG_08878 [Thecamonas trahens ATCC 50062]|eukprot:XP_013754418.1 hypothetical protein AMSG_08878 [Thecamonas trahens ATCC 50062]